MSIIPRFFPIELIYHIMSYTYEFQEKRLLEDIKSYTLTHPIITSIYNEKWIESPIETSSDWLINDITAFANSYMATMFGYTNNFYNIFLRNYRLKTRTQIDDYIKYMSTMSASKEINVFWGLFEPKERNYFIEVTLQYKCIMV